MPDLTVDALAAALIRAGWFFPSQGEDARTAAQDLLAIIADLKDLGRSAIANGIDPEGGAR